MRAALRREPFWEKEPPSIREALPNLSERMRAALRREPHYDVPSIREALAFAQTNARGAEARATV
eukprot:2946697-Pyramimonas_sp.AAC.1